MARVALQRGKGFGLHSFGGDVPLTVEKVTGSHCHQDVDQDLQQIANVNSVELSKSSGRGK